MFSVHLAPLFLFPGFTLLVLWSYDIDLVILFLLGLFPGERFFTWFSTQPLVSSSPWLFHHFVSLHFGVFMFSILPLSNASYWLLLLLSEKN